MVMKKCVECGNEFNAKGRAITCSDKCSKKRWKRYITRYMYEYNPAYYNKNWTKWQQYRKDAQFEKLGTGNLLGKMHKNRDGSPDFERELKLIKKEMILFGIIYHK